MKTEDVLKIEVDTLTEEEARVLSAEILEEHIDRIKGSAKRCAIVAAIVSAGLFLVGKNSGVLSYALMGIDSYFLVETFTSLFDIREKRKKLEKVKDGSFDGDYLGFIRDCQAYIKSHVPQINTSNQMKK